MKLNRRQRRSDNRSSPRAAILYLASICDGAVLRDGRGFASEHVQLGHDLALRARWRKAHRRRAKPLIRYYRRQLEEAGFDVDATLSQRSRFLVFWTN